MKIFINIYNYFLNHKWQYRIILTITIAILSLFAVRLHYTEDILSFMPFNDEQKQQFQIYQEQAKAQNITLIFEADDEDLIIESIEQFAENLNQQSDTPFNIQTTLDPNLFATQIDSICQRLPFLLTEADYQHIDSILTNEYIDRQIQSCRTKLLMPQSGILQPIISTDPLNLFNKYLQLPQQAGGAFDIVDGYIFAADHSKALTFVKSPYGSNESGQNAHFVDLINNVIDSIQAQQTTGNTISIRAIGAPVISVGNARRIKKDSIITIAIALIAIALLLFTNLKRKRDIIWMILTIGFGMVFALGIMGMITSEISLIVLGISSVIVGIAVNYPLHVIIHRDQRNDMPTTLREVLSPLIVGNITTVGAFLSLVPLQSKALHDLGLFSALMLIGTIIFSVIFLPLLIESKVESNKSKVERPLTLKDKRQKTKVERLISNSINKLAEIQPHNNKIVLTIVILTTIILTFFAPKLSFDSNLNNINYMTEQQRQDMNYFLEIAGRKNTQTIYIVQDITNPQPYLQQWNTFWQQHSDQLTYFTQSATQAGFQSKAFSPFLSLTSIAHNDSHSSVDGPVHITHTVEADPTTLAQTENALRQQYSNAQVFDIKTLNSQLTNSLSDNFDYIGIVCSLIVLIFLCINLRSIPLGLIAFTPMLIAWIWILGAMYLLGIQFNIVNIILATFIFGQGDDYTIFITEGLIYEHETGKPILTAYKRSIVLSALIMFIGIGVLVIAQHPAMRSLGIVTILGMMCVVTMAYIIPPALYKLYLQIQQKISKKR